MARWQKRRRSPRIDDRATPARREWSVGRPHRGLDDVRGPPRPALARARDPRGQHHPVAAARDRRRRPLQPPRAVLRRGAADAPSRGERDAAWQSRRPRRHRARDRRRLRSRRPDPHRRLGHRGRGRRVAGDEIGSRRADADGRHRQRGPRLDRRRRRRHPAGRGHRRRRRARSSTTRASSRSSSSTWRNDDPRPRARGRRHPGGPPGDRPGVHRLAAVRPSRPVRAARRPGHRQGRDRQPDPLVQGARDVGRRPPPGGAGEDRPRPPDRGARRPATSGRGSPTRRATWASRPWSSPRCTRTPAR